MTTINMLFFVKRRQRCRIELNRLNYAREHFCIIEPIHTYIYIYSFIHCLEVAIWWFLTQSYILLMSMNIFFYLMYLLRIKKKKKKKKKKMGAGVLSLIDPFINRRLYIYKTCWIRKNLSFTLGHILSYPEIFKKMSTFVDVRRIYYHMII